MSNNKALFLDRDGVINIDHGYVHTPEQFEFVDGIFELCLTAQQLGYQIIVITNQAGIGYGLYSQQQFEQLTQWMKAEFLKQGVTITDVYACPHHATKAKGQYKLACHCRKPEPGMLYMAQNQHHIDFSQSIFVGDKESDMQAAINAGVAKRILLTSQYHQQTESQSDFMLAKSLKNVTEWL